MDLVDIHQRQLRTVSLNHVVFSLGSETGFSVFYTRFIALSTSSASIVQSRPASNVSQSTTSGTRTQFLSPADADRPIPLPSHAEQTPTMVPLPPTGSTIPMSLPDGCLPPGFVPTGPPTPPLTFSCQLFRKHCRCAFSRWW